jgi:hypothetical protein
MVFIATLKNICEPVASHLQTLSHSIASSPPRHARIRTHNFNGKSVVVIPNTI